MRRFFILFSVTFKAWLRDPIAQIGGILPPTIMLVAFGILFGGRLWFQIAIYNLDQGEYGSVLVNSMDEVLSPFKLPYYEVIEMESEEAWNAYQSTRLDGIWVIPEDFSARILAGEYPEIEMHFINYNDDRAKNHRLYASEILWHFYQEIDMPYRMLELEETYPAEIMVDWFNVIAVGLVLLATTLGGMFNIFLLTYKEKIHHISREFGMAPRSILGMMAPKILLALLLGLASGGLVAGFVWAWTGVWPHTLIWLSVLIMVLVSLFWIGIAMIVGFQSRDFMAGAIGTVIAGVIVFFLAGGLTPVRFMKGSMLGLARLFPNTYAIDPLRDIMLFNAMPEDLGSVLGVLVGFAASGLLVGLFVVRRNLRRLD